MSSENIFDAKVDRRTFLKLAGVMGATVAASQYLKPISIVRASASPASGVYNIPGPDPVEGEAGVEIIRTTCLMCHNFDGVQAKVKDGVLLKLDGSPYNISTSDYLFENPPAGGIVAETDVPSTERGILCAKGQAGIMTLYDIHRVKNPLKRVGPRGSGKWKAISWDEAINEIVEGGDLFGEGSVDGLRAIRSFDPITSAESDYMDEAPPDGYGPKANQFVWIRGRNEQKDFSKHFVDYSFGSKNRQGHTSICEATQKAATEHTFGGKDHFKPDIENSDYLLIFGSSWLEASFTMISLSRWLVEFKEKGGKLVVLDPRFTNTASKADMWIPIKVATDGAFAMGMIKWIIENNRYAEDYLKRPNQTSASNGGYKNWTDATYLVNLNTRKYLTGDEAGIGTSDYVVSVVGDATKYEDVTGTADLDVDTTVNGIPVKSVFTLLKESANEKTIAEYESICGVESGTISTIASEFSDPTKKSAADFYKSGAQHANGFHTSRAILTLSIILGRVDRKGGISPGGGSYHGSKPAHPTKVPKEGVPIERHKVKYQGTKPKPTRPWYPLASHGVQQEIFPSIKIGYPYKVKAVLLYYSNPAYSMPYAQTVREVLQDTKAIPLLISIDAFVNESNMYADYILPDTTYLERWSIGHLAPHIKTKGTFIRQPVVGKVDPVTHEYTPYLPDTKTMEDIHIMIAKKLGLPNFGKDGMGAGKDLNNAWDYYNEYLSGEDFSGGLDPTTEHMKMAGKFENPNNRYDASGEWMSHPYGNLITIYSEEAATTKHSMTGEYFSGVAKYEPVKDSNGNEIKDGDYPFLVITHKPVYHTQARTQQNLWLTMLEPENFAEMNAKDAEKLGVKTGDLIRLRSPSNTKGILDPTGRDTIRVKVNNHIREGVIDISHSFGHWAMGATPYYVDGESSGSDQRKGTGGRMSDLMRADPVLKDVCVTDPIGGSAGQYYNPVKVEKV